jgi:hypothetical protein
LRRRPEDIAGWPEVQRELAPTALDPESSRLYQATWREFRRELGLAGGSTRRPTGWAADLRFWQKASLLRTAGTADFVDEDHYRRYDLEAEHNRVREELFAPICADIARVQFEIP